MGSLTYGYVNLSHPLIMSSFGVSTGLRCVIFDMRFLSCSNFNNSVFLGSRNSLVWFNIVRSIREVSQDPELKFPREGVQYLSLSLAYEH